MTIPAYPLQWPEGWKRTPLRRTAKFSKQRVEYRDWTDGSGQRHSNRITRRQDVTIAEAVERVRARATPPSETISLADLHESWYRILPAPQAAILRAVIEAHPKAIARDELADTVGVSRTSGGYFNNLGRLRTLGAIDYPTRGMVAAAAILFPGSRDG